METQLQTCVWESLGSTKLYGYNGCPGNEGDSWCGEWLGYISEYPDFKAAAALSCEPLDDR